MLKPMKILRLNPPPNQMMMNCPRLFILQESMPIHFSSTSNILKKLKWWLSKPRKIKSLRREWERKEKPGRRKKCNRKSLSRESKRLLSKNKKRSKKSSLRKRSKLLKLSYPSWKNWKKVSRGGSKDQTRRNSCSKKREGARRIEKTTRISAKSKPKFGHHICANWSIDIYTRKIGLPWEAYRCWDEGIITDCQLTKRTQFWGVIWLPDAENH